MLHLHQGNQYLSFRLFPPDSSSTLLFLFLSKSILDSMSFIASEASVPLMFYKEWQLQQFESKCALSAIDK